MIKQVSIPTRSAVATHTDSITRPFGTRVGSAEVVLGAGSGTVSVQFKGSNDNTNWTNIGSPVTSTNRAVSLSADTLVFQYYQVENVISTNTKVTDVTFYFA